MLLDQNFLKAALIDCTIIQSGFLRPLSFCIDSRTIKQGDIFVPLIGNTHNGHRFIADALAKGAAGFFFNRAQKSALVEHKDVIEPSHCIIEVPDTLQALFTIARAWRAQLSIPVVGITGSVGKTTTKELLVSVLKDAGKQVYGSFANQNTRLGVALNILAITQAHECAVIEMGISKRGEMEQLAELVKPSIGIITAIGHAHMEGLGSIQSVAAEKRDIFKYYAASSIGVINGDTSLLQSVSYRHPVMKFGLKMTNQVQARRIIKNGDGLDFVLSIYHEKYPIHLSKCHEGLVYNILAAASAAHLLGIPAIVIARGVQKPISVKGRFERVSARNGADIIINDAYNANPESVKSALTAFESIKTAHRKIAVIADMLELGASGPFWHRQIGRFFRKTPSITEVILVGNLVEWIQEALPVHVTAHVVPDWQSALQCINNRFAHMEKLILFKGSRAMQLDKVVEALTRPDSGDHIEVQSSSVQSASL